MLIRDLGVRIVNAVTGELIRGLTLDPHRDYQPRSRTERVQPNPNEGRLSPMA